MQRYDYSEINGNAILTDNLFGDKFYARIVNGKVRANTRLSLDLVVKYRKGLLLNYKITKTDISNEENANNWDNGNDWINDEF
jgi:hypothetical protein